MVFAGNLLAGRYQLHEPIGTGWFSEVWRATDAALSRPVAVKLLHPAYAQHADTLARFRAEALNAAALRHENIAHIYDYDVLAEGLQPYLVMELVDGSSLADVLVGGPLDAARTMDVVAQAAAGLRAAHAMGLVHRDIRPANLLLTSSGTVKITDWGISHPIDSVPSAVTEIVTGTAEYLAPERTAGAPGASASDLYALGVVAYECLSGTPPFVGEPSDVACAHRDHSVPPLPKSVPADVSALVMQLVAKDPAWRPDSAAEVAQQASRLRRGLRHDLRPDISVDAGRTPHPLAAAAAVPLPPPTAPAAVAADARPRIPAVPRPASRAAADARRLRRRPVLVFACAAIAGLIVMVLAVTVGVVPVQHLAGAPPSVPPGHSANGTAAGSPGRQPSSASPIRSALHSTGPGGTDAVPVLLTDHRTIARSASGRPRIRRRSDGRDVAHAHAHGHGHRSGSGNGNGHDNGNGQGIGSGQGTGNGNGSGQGNGQGIGQGNGNGNGQGIGQGNGNGNGQGNGNGSGEGNGNGNGQGDGIAGDVSPGQVRHDR